MDKKKFSVNDKKLSLFITNKDELSESRIRFYDIVFDELYQLMKLTPSEIIDKCVDDQKIFLDNGIPTKKEMTDRFVFELQTKYYGELNNKKTRKGKHLSKKTIKTKINSLRYFLKKYDIELPDAPEIKIKKTRVRDNEIPTWDDVELAISYAKSPRDKAIIGFAATSGFRVSDIANLKIIHLIKSCSIYFDENEEHTLENLLKKDPENICPCWDMDPQKTIWHGNLAITFNTPEVSVLLWQYLKYRIELNVRNKRGNIIDDDEPLFHSQTGGHLDPITISTKCSEINRKMGGKLDRNGVFGKFRIHNLRSLFKTTCKRNLHKVNVDSDMPFDGDVINLFTGHSSDNPHADVYEAVPEDSHDSYIRKVYEGLIPYLSIGRPSEVRSYSTKEFLEVEEYKKQVDEKFTTQEIRYQRDMDIKDKEIEQLKKQLSDKDKKHKNEINEIKQTMNETQKQVAQTNKAFEELKKIRNNSDIRNSITNYFHDAYRDDILQKEYDKNGEQSIGLKKCIVICEIAYEIALKNKSDFNADQSYLDKLIKKSIAKCSFNPNIIIPKYEEINNKNTKLIETNNEINNIVSDIIVIIANHEDIWEIVKEDQKNLKNIIVKEIQDSKYDIDNITLEDKNQIAEDVIMKFLDMI